MGKHPGLILREGFMEPLGIHASRLAAGTGVDRSTISRLLAGDQPLTPPMAARLGAYFGVPARWWLLMQAEYDAADVAARPELVRGVVPLEPNPDVLLTPTGVLRLDVAPPAVDEGGEVRTIRYDNGSVGLIGDDR
ncbi:MAG: HigA family addiction module antitoxin [Myxococcota bacterium]